MTHRHTVCNLHNGPFSADTIRGTNLCNGWRCISVFLWSLTLQELNVLAGEGTAQVTKITSGAKLKVSSSKIKVEVSCNMKKWFSY